MPRLVFALTFVLALSVRVSAQELTITDQIPGTFTDISSTGTALGLGDDGVAEITTAIDLTQTLFAGDGSGRVWVSNNGAVGFLGDGGSAGAFYLNTGLPNFGLFGGAHGEPQALAVYWDDLDSDTGDVYYETIGEPGSRVLIIQWQDRPHYPGDPELDGDEATFQVQIFENAVPGHAQFLYADTDFLDPLLNNGASATIGYQAGEIRNDVQWSFNEAGAVQAGVVLTLGDACTSDDDCDDGDLCTDDGCDPGSGCTHDAIVCNDENPCTDDACDPDVGCVFDPNEESCDDADLCTENDVCSGGACNGVPVECPEGQDCDPGTGECVCDDCPTDVDGDGDTGPFDLATLLGAWGVCEAGDACECLDADDDGQIGPFDLAFLLGAWGPCQ